ncbi:MAG: MarR family winged helix-turn-helix transcriptional regulator [Maricaulaceae bacterium]|jgi:DNA-binding MarR family transcriptional regulator
MATSSSGYNLQTSPSHLLHRAQQYAADRFSTAFGKQAITQRQFAVLVGVAQKEGLTQTDLVRATGIDRSTLAELVARMSSKGLLKRSRAKTDARANTVSLTPKGRTLLSGALPKVRAADSAILGTLAKTKQSGFVSTLKDIAETLDKAEEAASAPRKAAPKRTTKAKAKPKAKAKAKPKTRARAAAARTRTTAAKKRPAKRATTKKRTTRRR